MAVEEQRVFPAATMCYDDAIMMARSQISLDGELQARARRRAADLGLSFAAYVRRLIVRDLEEAPPAADPSAVFDLGTSGGSDIARNKDAMVAEAFGARPKDSS
ncbi:MAG: hypothetical protein ACC662_08560 [Planctomycetota bacterium]